MMISPVLIGASDTSVRADLAAKLSAIAYCAPHSIEAEVKQLGVEWDAVWVPTQGVQGNYAYVAFNGAQYVVAIRGSVLAFDAAGYYDWIVEDLNVLVQKNWPFVDAFSAGASLVEGQANAPKVAKGAWIGLQELMLLKSASGQSLLDFLMAYCILRERALAITGHSLGAGLAPLLAMWLRSEFLAVNHPPPKLFAVVTFAAPTTGNAAFAEAFDAAFPNSWRYFNELDIVPMSAANLLSMANLYPAPCPQADDVVIDGTMTLSRMFTGLQLLLDYAEAVSNNGSFYAHTNMHRGAVALNTQHELFSPAAKEPLVDWFDQAGHQHSIQNYIGWL